MSRKFRLGRKIVFLLVFILSIFPFVMGDDIYCRREELSTTRQVTYKSSWVTDIKKDGCRHDYDCMFGYICDDGGCVRLKCEKGYGFDEYGHKCVKMEEVRNDEKENYLKKLIPENKLNMLNRMKTPCYLCANVIPNWSCYTLFALLTWFLRFMVNKIRDKKNKLKYPVLSYGLLVLLIFFLVSIIIPFF